MASAPESESSLFHRALVLSNELQNLPQSMVAASFAVNSVLVAIFWLERGATAALVVVLSALIASLINWQLLRLLPQRKRSFGPDQPSALALSAATALVAVLLALIGASVSLTIAIIAVISVLAYYATWIEPFALTLTRERLLTSQWEGSADGDANNVCLRIMHIADIHVERTTAREQELNLMVATIKPDVIVFSGDFVNLSYNKDEQAKKDIRTIIGEWRAPLGVYCVPGTPAVEPLQRVVEFTQGLDNLKLLTNRWVTVETPCGALHILGLITTHDLTIDRAALAKAMESAPQNGVKLLLTHSPDLAPEAAEAGFDLYVCGHTHGGQIRLPLIGAMATASQYGRRFAMGRTQVGQTTVYTSRGVGMEGLGAPRARFLCKPEVILWEIGLS